MSKIFYLTKVFPKKRGMTDMVTIEELFFWVDCIIFFSVNPFLVVFPLTYYEKRVRLNYAVIVSKY